MPTNPKQEPTKRRSRARTPEAREREAIALAYDLAEDQLREGTASAMVITHFLKLATKEAELKLEQLRNDNRLAEARTAQIESQGHTEELFQKAIEAMTRYRGEKSDDSEPH